MMTAKEITQKLVEKIPEEVWDSYQELDEEQHDEINKAFAIIDYIVDRMDAEIDAIDAEGRECGVR